MLVSYKGLPLAELRAAVTCKPELWCSGGHAVLGSDSWSQVMLSLYQTTEQSLGPVLIYFTFMERMDGSVVGHVAPKNNPKP